MDEKILKDYKNLLVLLLYEDLTLVFVDKHFFLEELKT